eukprot:368525_1
MANFLTLFLSTVVIAFSQSDTITMFNTNTFDEMRDENNGIDIAYEDDRISIRKNELIFESSLNALFEKKFIEHDFKNDEKASNILKQQQKFKHYQKGESIIIVYDLDFFDMIITMKIPLNSFELDLERCSEKQQLEYYKNKVLNTESATKPKQTLSFLFNAQSVLTIYSNQELIEQYELIQRFNSLLYTKKSKAVVQLFKQNDVWFGDALTYVGDDNQQMIFLNQYAINGNLYFNTGVPQNKLRISAQLGFGINMLKLIKNNKFQQFLNEFSKDIVIAKANNS